MMETKPIIHVRSDVELELILKALIQHIEQRDGYKPTRSQAIRRAVTYTERMMRPSDEETK